MPRTEVNIFLTQFLWSIDDGFNQSNSIFAEYKKVVGQFKLPGIDVGALLDSRRKDVEAIVEANTTALAGVQSLAQKQSEILRTTLTEVQSLAGRVAQSGGQSGGQHG